MANNSSPYFRSHGRQPVPRPVIIPPSGAVVRARDNAAQRAAYASTVQGALREDAMRASGGGAMAGALPVIPGPFSNERMSQADLDTANRRLGQMRPLDNIPVVGNALDPRDRQAMDVGRPAPTGPMDAIAESRPADGGYGNISEVKGSSGDVHQVQSTGNYWDMMEAQHPGFGAMTQAQKSAVLRTMSHSAGLGTDTTPAPVFNSRGESTNDGTITYDPRRDAQKYAAGPLDALTYSGDVPQRDLPPGASRGVVIDPKYVPKGGSNVGTGRDVAPPPVVPTGRAVPGTDWQSQLVAKYPEIGVAGSPHNTAFVSAYNQHKDPAQAEETAANVYRSLEMNKGANPSNTPQLYTPPTAAQPGDGSVTNDAEASLPNPAARSSTTPPSTPYQAGQATRKVIGTGVSTAVGAGVSAVSHGLNKAADAASAGTDFAGGLLGIPDVRGTAAARPTTSEMMQGAQPPGTAARLAGMYKQSAQPTPATPAPTPAKSFGFASVADGSAKAGDQAQASPVLFGGHKPIDPPIDTPITSPSGLPITPPIDPKSKISDYNDDVQALSGGLAGN